MQARGMREDERGEGRGIAIRGENQQEAVPDSHRAHRARVDFNLLDREGYSTPRGHVDTDV